MKRREAPHQSPVPERTTQKQAFPSAVGAGVFFVLFYVYVWLVIDPRLLHHSLGLLGAYHGVACSTEWSFIWQCVSKPGGVVDYAARFLWQFFCYGWAGAAIVAGVAWATSWAIDDLTDAADRPRGLMVRYGPAVLLAVIFGHYEQPLKMLLSLLVALACFAAYRRWTSEGGRGRSVIVLMVTGVVAFLIAGAGGLAFLGLVAILELFHRRRGLVALLALLVFVAVPLVVGVAIFRRPVSEQYWGFLLADDQAGRPNWLFAALYVVFPVVLLGAAGSHHRLTRHGAVARSRATTSWHTRVFHFLSWRESSQSMRLTLVCLAAGTVAWCTLDRNIRFVLQTDYYCQHGDWAEVLDTASRFSAGRVHTYAQPNILLALCRTGRLLDEMFHYPQVSREPSYQLIVPQGNRVVYTQESRVFLELGELNLAEKCCLEAMIQSGERPSLLKELALIHIAKQRPETARVFLNRLHKMLLQRSEAEAVLRELDQDAPKDGESDVKRLRRFMSRTDRASIKIRWDELLLGLLKENPDNRAAYDLLNALYLCNLELDKVVASLSGLERCGYRRIPYHLQEAIVIQSSRTGGALAVEKGLISSVTWERARMFSEIFRRFPDRQEAARASAESGLGNTYFHYYAFGESGR